MSIYDPSLAVLSWLQIEKNFKRYKRFGNAGWLIIFASTFALCFMGFLLYRGSQALKYGRCFIANDLPPKAVSVLIFNEGFKLMSFTVAVVVLVVVQ